jgi:very-short-patch-repair endonuclease
VLRGWGLLVEPVRTVEVAVVHARSSLVLPGVRVQRRRGLTGEEVQVLPGTRALRLEPAVDTLTSMAAGRTLTEAVVAWDSALRAGAVSREELEAAVDRLQGRAATRAGRVLGLCDGLAGSVLESVHRVQLVLAGLTGFTLQLVVRDLPALRVDFAWPHAGLVVEVDGARWHPDPAVDRARDNALAQLGWRVLRYTWAEVLHDQARVLAEIRAALAAGGPRTQLVREGLAVAS